MILDATCSLKRLWPERADVRMDIDLHARPDVRADATRLPFRDESFTEVYCDPPHFIRFNGDHTWQTQFDGRNYQRAEYSRFSSWPNKRAWLHFLDLSMVEFERVLRPMGNLHYKVPDGSRSHGRVVHYEDVLNAAESVGLESKPWKAYISGGFLSNANVRRGRAASTIFELCLYKRDGV